MVMINSCIEILGYDKTKNGEWIYLTGYDYNCSKYEKIVHYNWALKLISIGFRIGVSDSDGVKSFYIFKQ